MTHTCQTRLPCKPALTNASYVASASESKLEGLAVHDIQQFVFVSACFVLVHLQNSIRMFDCADVDECVSVPTACTNGQCVNNQGSYRCECRDGFTLAKDGKTCLGTQIEIFTYIIIYIYIYFSRMCFLCFRLSHSFSLQPVI